jgi:hypothetical protein
MGWDRKQHVGQEEWKVSTSKTLRVAAYIAVARSATTASCSLQSAGRRGYYVKMARVGCGSRTLDSGASPKTTRSSWAIRGGKQPTSNPTLAEGNRRWERKLLQAASLKECPFR